MARKPMRGTVAENVLAYGTGALNIDGTRIGTTQEERDWIERTARPNTRGERSEGAVMNRPAEPTVNVSPLGRWPANVILTDPIFDGGIEGVVGGGDQSGGGNPPRRSAEIVASQRAAYGGGWAGGETYAEPFDTAGTYSRFFLVPKADRADREPVLGGLPLRRTGTMQDDAYRWERDGKGNAINLRTERENTHPTVKPTELMRHLVRLVTPTGGVVLDPFAGSGSTLIAAEMEGFAWIGIEKEAEYVAIAEARLNGTQRGLGLSA
jgi:site-specific DNA-methyltransferase (adenine-specific)